MLLFIKGFFIGIGIGAIVGLIYIAFLMLREVYRQDKAHQKKVNDSLKKGNRLN